MTRRQRLRSCGNLAQLIETAKSERAAATYRQQLDKTKMQPDNMSAAKAV